MIAPRSFEDKANFYSNLYLGKNTQVVAKDFYPDNLDEAYKIQDYILEQSGEDFQHFKLGGTNIKTQKKFNVSRSYFGLVKASETFQVTENNQVIHLGNQEPLSAELEIIFKLSKAITPSDEVTIDNLNQFISHYSVGLEFPTNFITNLTEVGVNGLVAENCAAGFLVYGEFYDFTSNDFDQAQDFSFRVGLENIIQGTTANLIGGAIGAMLDFVLLMQEHERDIPADSLISTGGMTNCVPIARGSLISVEDGVASFSFFIA
mgnify:CR=1 FL=1